MLATDSVALGDVRVSDGGYLEAVARTARTGIQVYRGVDVLRPDLATVNVYRDAAEVFSKRSLESFSKLPLTVDHPPQGVSAGNWKQVAVGTTGDEVLRDGEMLKIGLKVMDAAAIQAIRDGKRELSVGYSTELVWEDGKAPDGTPYQARQTSIVANHIAIVDAGRAGPSCRISDSWADPSPSIQEDRTMPDTNRTVMVDGLSVLTTDQGAQAIDKLTKDRDTANKALADALEAHKAAIAAKDKELGTKDGEITKLKSEALDAAKLDKLVADRADVFAKAKSIANDVDPSGKTIPDIRRAVVSKKLGDASVKERSDDYVEALFDSLASQVKPQLDAAARVIAGGLKTSDAQVSLDDAERAAHAAMEERMRKAWAGEQPKGNA